jgi:hypothetical protein
MPMINGPEHQSRRCTRPQGIVVSKLELVVTRDLERIFHHAHA